MYRRVIKTCWEGRWACGWVCGVLGECVGGQVALVGRSFGVWEGKRADVWVAGHVGG